MMTKDKILDLISVLFVLLFVYAAVSKFIEFDKFKIQVGQSPILTDFADYVIWVIPIVEIAISVLLMIPRFRLWGLYAAFCLMLMFTTYIVLILNFSKNIPCSCGGILGRLGWKEHLYFNAGFTLLAIVGLIICYQVESKNVLRSTVNG